MGVSFSETPIFHLFLLHYTTYTVSVYSTSLHNINKIYLLVFIWRGITNIYISLLKHISHTLKEAFGGGRTWFYVF